MSTVTGERQSVETFEICKEIEISAPIDIAFEAMLDEIGPENRMLDGKPFPMKIEPWPGGRWYRDLGNNSGHLWGHVQVIKAPTLLELSGPMFMSYPAINHLELKLDEAEGGTKVTLRHRAVGLIDPQHREGVVTGWNGFLESVKGDFAKTSESAA